LTGRPAVLAAAGNTPYARLMMSSSVTGYQTASALAWTSVGPWGPVGCVLGPVDESAALVSRLLDGGQLAHIPHLHVPVGCPVALPYLEDWEARTLVGPPPRVARAEEVVPVDDAQAIEKVLAEALPHTSSRPGDPGVRGWYGIRGPDGELLACGADRSANGVGNLVGIAVRPQAWGQGLGAAVTAAMTARLYAEFGAVVLGVTVGNERAIGLYERLGFTDSFPRASYEGPSIATTPGN
jgi:ribosomal protein S18 acetylase RimI-like enzyme